MNLFQLFMVLFVAMVEATAAVPSEFPARGHALDGFTIGPLTWTGPVVDGGINYTFSGTAEVRSSLAPEKTSTDSFVLQEIYNQILKVNPDFLIRTPIAYRTSEPDEGTNVDVNCDPHEDWDSASVQQLKKEANWLKSLGDRQCNAGVDGCARVSCSYNTAVYLCNLRDYDWGPSCNEVADHVLAIADMCEAWDDETDSSRAKGTITKNGDYRVWAGKANPSC